MVANLAEHATDNAEIAYLDEIFTRQKAAYQKAPYPSAEERIDHIKRLKPALLKHMDNLVAALNQDFGNRAEAETKLAEIMTTLEGIRYYSKRVRRWMKPARRHIGVAQFPGKARVVYQPLGVVGVISPWNYPVYLATGPMLAALAAGNRVMIKMSEYTPATAEAFRTMIREFYDEDHVAVVTGGPEVGMAFSRKPFDHLLFTGATAVGHHIMRAAAENLTPVTLELGGKSPVIIHPSYPIRDAVERISFGKCFNAGQTCVSPDYIFLPQEKTDEFIQCFRQQVSTMYPTMRDNPDFTSVINERHHQRLKGYLDDAVSKGARLIEINPANEDFTGTHKMPFTLVLDVTEDMTIAQQEIFGPLLILKPYGKIREALDYVNSHPRPLALYYFDNDKTRSEQILYQTHSGGVCLNDTMSHVGVDDIPFGGIGDSGMGHYHGYEGFLTFSKAKGVYEKGRINATRLALPPFNKASVKFMLKYLIR